MTELSPRNWRTLHANWKLLFKSTDESAVTDNKAELFSKWEIIYQNLVNNQFACAKQNNTAQVFLFY